MRVCTTGAAETNEAWKAVAERYKAEGVRNGSPKNDGWWWKRFIAKGELIAAIGGEADLVLLGDSITHGWDNAGAMKRLRTKYPKILPLGFNGDTVSSLTWRCANGELDGYETKCVMLLIGTNNGLEDSPEDVASGVRAILDVIAAKQPKAKTVLIPILLRGANAEDPCRIRNEKANELIRAFADGDRVRWCDFRGKLVKADGTPDFRVMRDDKLHLIAAGYDVWMEAVLPLIREVVR